MSTKEDYDAKVAIITAIGDDQVKVPNNIPVDVYIQEAENLYHWCQEDQAELTAKGFDWLLADDLPVRSGALREAESLWNLERFTREEAARQWAEESPAAYELRNQLLHDFRFAFRNDTDLSGKVSDIAEGSSHADMLQDLNDLSVLGKENLDLLAAINFDVSLLDQAAQVADEKAVLLAVATGERIEYSEAKKIRDQAYTHLKEAVDEIYSYGQYVFWHDDDRLKGYRSNYLRRKRTKKSPEPTTPDAPSAPEVKSQ
ncbi:MAG: hypothetical protein GTO45_05730 [Candidatus Aminicenantes bacterium]|nr:hypothetical protein [Candidatus Aminicenantes bacterium]NIM78350.1 hypothetical protein [Candidatus Aminicenantes bacterium]NIN17584.1 hypothetical protein [Candidatus Aminicenantes bacterium]NIN41462.1 hypothetical protein [Candidatus Aminicenantes bacterium]NIN84236.1 hypothetical protein [Candidatus Aminicenantes bacterium]